MFCKHWLIITMKLNFIRCAMSQTTGATSKGQVLSTQVWSDEGFKGNNSLFAGLQAWWAKRAPTAVGPPKDKDAMQQLYPKEHTHPAHFPGRASQTWQLGKPGSFSLQCKTQKKATPILPK